MPTSAVYALLHEMNECGGLYSNNRLCKGQSSRCDYMAHAKEHPWLVDESILMKKRTIMKKMKEFVLL